MALHLQTGFFRGLFCPELNRRFSGSSSPPKGGFPFPAFSTIPSVFARIKKRTIKRSHVIADLHEIASGKKAARTSADSITLFRA
jgi:hypothetical protein